MGDNISHKCVLTIACFLLLPATLSVAVLQYGWIDLNDQELTEMIVSKRKYVNTAYATSFTILVISNTIDALINIFRKIKNLLTH